MIKQTNEKDYQALLIAIHNYWEHKDEDNKLFARQKAAVVKDIIDKYGVKYTDDVSERI